MNYSLLYVLLIAISAVLREYSGLVVPTALVLAIGSFISIIFYNLVNIKNLKIIYGKFWNIKKHFFYVNLSIAGLWVAAVYGPIWIGASLYTFLFFGLLGLLGQLDIFFQENSKSLVRLIGIIGVLFLIVWSIISSNIQHPSLYNILGILLTFVGSISGYIYSKHSAMLMSDYHVKPTEIIAVRFYLSLVIGLLLLPTHVSSYLTFSNINFCLLTSLFSFIIPLYFFQFALKKIGAELQSIISSMSPFVTSILEHTFLHTVHYHFFFIYLAYTGFTCLPLMIIVKEKILKTKISNIEARDKVAEL